MIYQLPKLFPNTEIENVLICVSDVGYAKGFSTIITDLLPDLEIVGKSQCFPLYYYEEQEKQHATLFDSAIDKKEFIRRDAVSDFILGR